MGMTAALVAATAFTAFSQYQQGQQQAEAYEAQAEQTKLEGVQAKADAMTQADKIRRAGRNQRGETKAQLAASGVKLGEGTALEIDNDIIQKSEEDAFSAMLTGNRAYQSAETTARSMRNAGRNASSNSVLAAAGTVGQGWYMGSKG